ASTFIEPAARDSSSPQPLANSVKQLKDGRLRTMSEMTMAKAAPEKEVDTALLVTRKNPRGIPEVVFIDDVVQFLARLGVEEVETPIGAFNELYSKYKLMESNMDKAKQSMKDK
ncbi:unnamed protein product, partial [Ectocarpus sp. 12 AP-2014]